MRNKKKLNSVILLYLLTSLIILIASSCGEPNDSKSRDRIKDENNPSLYYSEEVVLPDNVLAVSSISKIDDKNIALMAVTSNGTSVMQWNFDSKQSVTIFSQVESEQNLVSAAAVPGGSSIWCIAEQQDGSIFLCYINQYKQVGEPIPLSDEVFQYNIENLICDKSGNVYLSRENTQTKNGVEIIGYAPNGTECFRCEDINKTGVLLQQNDAILFIKNNGEVCQLNTLNNTITPQETIAGDYENLFFVVDNTFYGYNEDDFCKYTADDSVSVFSISSSGIVGNPNIENVLPMADDSYLMLAGPKLLLIQPGEDPSETDSRSIVTVGTLGVSQALAESVSQFNQDHDDYRVEIIDYCTFGADGDISASLNLFRTQMLAGSGPDIISFGVAGNCDVAGINADTLQPSGMLADLNTFLTQDRDLSKTSFYDGLIKALDTDGAIYQLPSGFYIRSVAASSDIVGERSGWTFADMLEATNKLPNLEYAFGSTIQRQRLLELLLAFNVESFVDYETCLCSFDSQEFIELLEFLDNSFTAEDGQMEIPAYAVAAGRQMLGALCVGTVVELQEYEAIFPNLTFIGMPSVSGTGSAFSITNSFGINAASAKQSGAWEFLRFVYLSDIYDGFPSDNAKLQERLDSPEKYEPYDTIIGYEDEKGGSWEFSLKKPTPENSKTASYLISLADRIYHPDDIISDIVWEEAQAYFDGSKSAEEVAQVIQNRVTIYVNELK